MASLQFHGDDERNFLLRFQTLSGVGRAYAFPCDAIGQVDIDALSDRARNHYLYARAMIGFEFREPVVQPCAAV